MSRRKYRYPVKIEPRLEIGCQLPVTGERLPLADCRCCGHRNGRHIADGQVAGSNVGDGASSSGGRLALLSLEGSFSSVVVRSCKWQINAFVPMVRHPMRHPGTTSAPTRINDGLPQPVHALLPSRMVNRQRQDKAGAIKLHAIEERGTQEAHQVLAPWALLVFQAARGARHPPKARSRKEKQSSGE